MSTLLALCSVLYGLCAGVRADDGSLPHITPDGYNASLHQSEVELRCLLPNDANSFLWLIDGVSSFDIRPENRTQQGLRFNHEILTEDDQRYAAIFIDPRSEKNNTVFQCIAFITNPPQIHNSNEVVFRVQGLLDPPTDLRTEYFNSTHQVLRWTDPFTLDLTASEDDITGYSVTVVMEDPPPSPPYPSSHHLPTHTSNQTQSITPPEFHFPHYLFPVWLSVRAENPVGLGAPSLLLQYSPSTLENCLRLRDLVSEDYLESRVMFDSAQVPSVEVVLSQTPSQDEDLCMDTVMVTLSPRHSTHSTGSSGSGEGSGEGETEVLVPSLREGEITLLLGQHLLVPHTHYSASLSLDQQHTVLTSFSTYVVQDVLVKVEASAMKVECVFADQVSLEITCTVVVEGELGQWVETFRGTHTFSGLSTGNYTVSVYDSQQDMEERGHYPAVEREVEVTGTTNTPPLPTSSTPTVPGSECVSSCTPTPMSTSTKINTDGKESSGVLVIAASVGTALCILLICLAIIIIVIVWIKWKAKDSIETRNVVYEEISPLSASVIPTETNAAYAGISPISPAIPTETNAAYAGISVLNVA